MAACNSILLPLCDRASLVATPSTARFQDALAFTRSLGDLHLQTYGMKNIEYYTIYVYMYIYIYIYKYVIHACMQM